MHAICPNLVRLNHRTIGGLNRTLRCHLIQSLSNPVKPPKTLKAAAWWCHLNQSLSNPSHANLLFNLLIKLHNQPWNNHKAQHPKLSQIKQRNECNDYPDTVTVTKIHSRDLLPRLPALSALLVLGLTGVIQCTAYFKSLGYQDLL